MKEFFYGWRRKAGLVTLVMALAVFGVWIRSLVARDWLTTTFNGEVHDVISYNGSVCWWATAVDLEKPTAIERLIVTGEQRVNYHHNSMRIWRDWSQRNQGREWIIPHWQFVLLLTLLSAYLLLAPSRTRTSSN